MSNLNDFENQRNSYKIKVIKNQENDNINENKENVNGFKSFLKSKSINNINNVKNILDNSFREKKSSRNSSIEPKNNSLFFQSKKSKNINKRNNKCQIFNKEPISPIEKYWKNNNNDNFTLNLIKLTNQLYEYEEHLKKSLLSDKNESKINISKDSNTDNSYLNKKKAKIKIYKKQISVKSVNIFNKNNEKKKLKIISKFNPLNKIIPKEEERKSCNSNNKLSNNKKIQRDKIKKNYKSYYSSKLLSIVSRCKKNDNKIKVNDIKIRDNKKNENQNIFKNRQKYSFCCCFNS